MQLGWSTRPIKTMKIIEKVQHDVYYLTVRSFWESRTAEWTQAPAKEGAKSALPMTRPKLTDLMIPGRRPKNFKDSTRFIEIRFVIFYLITMF